MIETRPVTLHETVWITLLLLARRTSTTEEDVLAKLITEKDRQYTNANSEACEEQRRAAYAADPPDVTTLPVNDPYLDYIRQRPRVEQDPDWRP